jgi:hypothetical protein
VGFDFFAQLGIVTRNYDAGAHLKGKFHLSLSSPPPVPQLTGAISEGQPASRRSDYTDRPLTSVVALGPQSIENMILSTN